MNLAAWLTVPQSPSSCTITFPRGLALAGAIYHANPRRVLKAMKLKAELLFLPAFAFLPYFFFRSQVQSWRYDYRRTRRKRLESELKPFGRTAMIGIYGRPFQFARSGCIQRGWGNRVSYGEKGATFGLSSPPNWLLILCVGALLFITIRGIN